MPNNDNDDSKNIKKLDKKYRGQGNGFMRIRTQENADYINVIDKKDPYKCKETLK